MSQEYVDDCFDASHAVQTDMGNIEKNFAALKSCFSGSSVPANTVAGMWWFDTASNILKLRNEANNAWLSIWDLANNKPVITNLSAEITDAMVATANKDGAAATPCMRTLGTGASQAMPGNTLFSGIPSHIAVFTSSGTWTKPSGVSYVYVKIWGGGGGGGTSSGDNNGYGGGGGGYAEGIVQVTGNVSVTIGAGGSHDNNGGNSSFVGATSLIANGGAGGSSNNGGSGGGASIGGTTYGFAISGGNGNYSGGGSPMGGAGGSHGSAAGVSGCVPGGGGGGGGGGYSGGAGANGLCIIMW